MLLRHHIYSSMAGGDLNVPVPDSSNKQSINNFIVIVYRGPTPGSDFTHVSVPASLPLVSSPLLTQYIIICTIYRSSGVAVKPNWRVGF